ncbi:MAG: TPM domain-containing protein [Candidatus Omnitrophota bacterium]
MKFKIFVLAALIFLFTGTLSAQENFPQYTGYVNDFSGVLSAPDKIKLENLLFRLEQKTTAQVAVVSIDTVNPLDIESYAVQLFEQWGIGQKGKDNGVLLLVAVKDKNLRIEVGYGLEGAIPDALANRIIADIIVPSFKQGNYSKGITDGVFAVTKLVADEYNVPSSELGEDLSAVVVPQQTAASSGLRILFTLFLFILVFSMRSGLLWFFILTPHSHHRRGGYWYGGGSRGSSGGFGGGFGGFGGGMSGGGGASGGW